MDYLKHQLITYLGNKRSLLTNNIDKSYRLACEELDQDSISVLDGFAGSGIVSRFLKSSGCSHIISNDFETYASAIGRCYLSNQSEVDMKTLSDIVTEIESKKFDKQPVGIIETHYAPHNDDDIQKDERVFYSNRNAKIIDNIRRLINDYPPEYKDLLMGPLLSEASVHTNTSGVFKGFYKDSKTGLGKFGGNKGAALSRILGEVVLKVPILCDLECPSEVYCEDINTLIKHITPVQFAYFDPPYNQHPYGSNYHMLNCIYNYEEPTNPSKVAGIPSNWQRSEYNYNKRAHEALETLIQDTKANVLAFSYNSEGFVSFDEFKEICEAYGVLDVLDQEYNTFRGSRNLASRLTHVTEYVFMIFK